MKPIFILGTTAEGLKVSPILRRLSKLDQDFEIWSTGQHVEDLHLGLKAIGIQNINATLAQGLWGRNLESRWKVAFWSIKVLSNMLPRLIFRKGIFVVVHGDTMSTLLASIGARMALKKIVHIEAGYRSQNWKSPFPEEIIRRIVSRLVTYHVAPSLDQVTNLLNEGVLEVNIAHTGVNTAADNLFDFAIGMSEIKDICLVTIHRSESIDDRHFMNDLVESLNSLSISMEIILVADTRLKHALDRCTHTLNLPIQVVPKQSFVEFMKLVSRAAFVVTDSGGLQQELAILGIPTLIHREVTESSDGIGENVRLSRGDVKEIHSFASNYNAYKRPIRFLENSPSDLAITAFNGWNLLDR